MQTNDSKNDDIATGNSKKQQSNSFTKENLKKQFRFSEFFAEKIITGVAFLSITIIVLIFLFVFREALPLFKKSPVKVVNIEQVAMKPESYSSESVPLKPETYGNESTPEGSLNSDSQSDELKPEKYGAVADTALTNLNNSAPTNYGEANQESVNENNNQAAWKSLTGKDWYPVSEIPNSKP